MQRASEAGLVRGEANRHPAPNPYEVPGCQETNSSHERSLGFFPQFATWGRQSLATCFDCIAIEGADRPCLPQTRMEPLSPGIGDGRETPGGPRRPRNISAPLCRPLHQDGVTADVRQCAAGAGEGQHTATVDA